MNWLDISILIIVIVFALYGFRNGLIKEIVSMIAIIAGIIAGLIFYSVAADIFIKYGVVQSRSIASVGGFIVVTFIFYVIVQILGWLLTGIMGSLHLNWLNRLVGAAFGIFKGGVIAYLLVSGLSFFFSDKEPPFSDSNVLPYLNKSVAIVRDTVPDDFKERVQTARKLINEKGLKSAMREAEKFRGIFKSEESGQ